MGEAILLSYQSVSIVNGWTVALLALLTGALTIRAIQDFKDGFDEDIGIKGSLRKVKKRLYAAVLAFCATALVSWIKKFYR